MRIEFTDSSREQVGNNPLLVGGDEAIKSRYLPEVARGEAMFSYALSEPEAGSDAASMRSRAVRDGDGWILNGNKRWIKCRDLQVLHRHGEHRSRQGPQGYFGICCPR